MFIFSVAGLTWIFTSSKIFKPLREKVSLKRQSAKGWWIKLWLFLEGVLNCDGCFGFWASFVIYLLQKVKLEILLYAFIGAISSLILIGLTKFLEKK